MGTIKHGDINNLEDYQGGREYDDLEKFANENLGPSCGPANLDLCDAAQKKAIEDAQAMSDADLDAKITAEEKKLEDAETNFKAEVEKLQATYEKLPRRRTRLLPTSRSPASVCSSPSRPTRLPRSKL